MTAVDLGMDLAMLVLSILCVAYFSASETAITSLGKLKLRELIERQPPRRKRYFQEWLERPEKYLVTILLGNTLVMVGAASMATLFTIDALKAFAHVESTDALVVGLSTGVMTFLILVFGEITPKNYAKQNSEAVAEKFIGTLYRISELFSTVVFVFTWMSDRLILLFGGKRIRETHLITESELKNLMQASSRDGLIEKHELEMLHSIFEFDDTLVRQIMVPRVDMVAVEAGSTLEEILKVAIDSGYTRLPVYEDRLDNMLGILYVKDLLTLWQTNTKELDLRKHLRKPLFVPEAKKVNRLLQDFKRQRTHMAMVVDEYGGVAGIITIEDIIEEIVGEIRDEYDEAELDKIAHLTDGSYVIDAALPISEFNEKFSASLKSVTADSIGGLMVEQAGAIPPKGSVITLNTLKFTVVASDEKRVSKIKLEIPKAAP